MPLLEIWIAKVRCCALLLDIKIDLPLTKADRNLDITVGKKTHLARRPQAHSLAIKRPLMLRPQTERNRYFSQVPHLETLRRTASLQTSSGLGLTSIQTNLGKLPITNRQYRLHRQRGRAQSLQHVCRWLSLKPNLLLFLCATALKYIPL